MDKAHISFCELCCRLWAGFSSHEAVARQKWAGVFVLDICWGFKIQTSYFLVFNPRPRRVKFSLFRSRGNDKEIFWRKNEHKQKLLLFLIRPKMAKTVAVASADIAFKFDNVFTSFSNWNLLAIKTFFVVWVSHGFFELVFQTHKKFHRSKERAREKQYFSDIWYHLCTKTDRSARLFC